MGDSGVERNNRFGIVEDPISEKSSSQSDSMFDSDQDDDSNESEELDFDSEWSEAKAIFNQESDDA